MEEPTLRYTCPRCGHEHTKISHGEPVTTFVEAFFRCPTCEANICVKYAYQFTIEGTKLVTMGTREWNPDMPVIAARNKAKKKSLSD
jgi:Zn finger protein HypA/HybF involved in hydrogenase expression